MNLWFYALLVFLGGCSYGVVSTFVKLGYAAGFGVNALTGSQYLLGALLLWILASFVPKSPLRKKKLGCFTAQRDANGTNRDFL